MPFRSADEQDKSPSRKSEDVKEYWDGKVVGTCAPCQLSCRLSSIVIIRKAKRTLTFGWLFLWCLLFFHFSLFVFLVGGKETEREWNPPYPPTLNYPPTTSFVKLSPPGRRFSEISSEIKASKPPPEKSETWSFFFFSFFLFTIIFFTAGLWLLSPVGFLIFFYL